MVTYTRIELRDAPPEAYQTLHDAMTVAGFSSTVKAQNGVVYALPAAMYQCRSKRTISHVLQTARSIAKNLGYESNIITIPSKGAHWHLTEVEPEPATK